MLDIYKTQLDQMGFTISNTKHEAHLSAFIITTDFEFHVDIYNMAHNGPSIYLKKAYLDIIKGLCVCFKLDEKEPLAKLFLRFDDFRPGE
jgi:hypothetical protein